MSLLPEDRGDGCKRFEVLILRVHARQVPTHHLREEGRKRGCKKEEGDKGNDHGGKFSDISNDSNNSVKNGGIGGTGGNLIKKKKKKIVVTLVDVTES